MRFAAALAVFSVIIVFAARSFDRQDTLDKPTVVGSTPTHPSPRPLAPPPQSQTAHTFESDLPSIQALVSRARHGADWSERNLAIDQLSRFATEESLSALVDLLQFLRSERSREANTACYSIIQMLGALTPVDRADEWLRRAVQDAPRKSGSLCGIAGRALSEAWAGDVGRFESARARLLLEENPNEQHLILAALMTSANKPMLHADCERLYSETRDEQIRMYILMNGGNLDADFLPQLARRLPDKFNLMPSDEIDKVAWATAAGLGIHAQTYPLRVDEVGALLIDLAVRDELSEKAFRYLAEQLAVSSPRQFEELALTNVNPARSATIQRISDDLAKGTAIQAPFIQPIHTK
jgi:hypothetical protein